MTISKRERRFPFRMQHVPLAQQDAKWQCESCPAPIETLDSRWCLSCRIASIGKTARKESSMIDLTTISKSYPYLSLARQLGVSYSDVLIVSELYTPSTYLPANPFNEAAMRRVSPHRHDICQLTCAVVNGEIGHGD